MVKKYKGVSTRKYNCSSGTKKWVCTYKGRKSYFEEERQAAKNYDLQRIRDGKDPVNILKPVKSN